MKLGSTVSAAGSWVSTPVGNLVGALGRFVRFLIRLLGRGREMPFGQSIVFAGRTHSGTNGDSRQ